MIEIYLIITGVIFVGWLYALVRQTQRGISTDTVTPPRPVVPVNLMDSDEAIIVAEARGRVVYANDQARQWFGINGGTPNLMLMAQMVQPADTLHDLIADSGHASFRLGQKRIEAVSHPIPTEEGRKMVVVMRELTPAAFQTYTEFDPLRALAIMNDIGAAVSAGLNLEAAIEAILRSIDQSIVFDAAEVTLWEPETQTLRPLHHTVKPLQTQPDVTYRPDEGYSGWIATYRQPLLITDIATRTDVLPKAFNTGYQSFVGIPLIVSDRFIGTLELLHRGRSAFSQRDLSLLQTLSTQIAATIEAAHLYRDQQARLDELIGLQQIAEAMSQLGEPSELFAQLTQRIAALADVELCGVLLYDEDSQLIRSQPPFYGVPDSLIRHYRLSILPDTELYSIWRHQPWWFTNAPSRDLIHAMGFEELAATIALNNLALIPMIVGARRIGLLLVANKHGKAVFAEGDMRALMSFASQAAVVVENARLYAEEQRRTRELGGLQQIAQAMGVLRSPNELIGQITERIATLMNVEMCGVLLFDPKDRVLVSQRPFYGMDDEESVNFYQLRSEPDSLIARLWQDRDTWYSNDLRRDPVLGDTDLVRLAAVVGIRQTVIATLVVGGNRLGIIQASNKRDGSEFTEDDARILSIFAGQAAVLIDNARLYREMQRRTHEAEGLRVITEMAAVVEPEGESVERVLVAIANLLESRIVSVALVDEATGKLVIAPQYTLGVTLDQAIEIDAYAPGFEDSVLVSRRPFMSNDLRADKRVLADYRKLADRFRLRNAILVPLILQDRSIGELSVANKTPGESYSEGDVELLMAIAPQVASMVERIRLYQTTDQDLRARLQELHALSRVTFELGQTIELERILDVIRQEALRSTNAIAASVVLLHDRQDWGKTDEPLLDQRFGETRTLAKLAPIERLAIVRHETVLVQNYLDSPLDPLPAHALSALAVPISFGEDVVGVLHLYSDEFSAFDQRVVEFVESLAHQSAIAIGNARRYKELLTANQQLRIRAERMGRLFELGEMFRQGASLPELLEEVAHSVQETVGYNTVLISLVDERHQVMRRTAQAGLPLATFEEMQRITPPLAQALGLMQPEFRISNSYFLPAEGTADITSNLPTYQVIKERMGPGMRAWDPQDLLLVPLYGARGRILGIISVDEPRSGRRPDLDTVEALEIFASQAAFIIENFRLIERIQQEAEATRRERDRLAQLHLVATQIQGAPDVPSRLQVVADGIHQAGWGRVVITLRDEHLEPTALIHAGYSPDDALHLSDTVVPGKVWRAWLNDLEFHQLKLGAGYYLRYNHPWVRQHVFQGQEPEPPEVPDDVWHPQDVLYLTLVGQDQKRIIGIIGMENPADGRVPSEASLQPFELFASQAAAAIETTRLYLETVRAAEQEARINEVMAAVSSSLSPGEVIQAVGRGLQQMVPFTRMSIALYNADMSHFDVLRADTALDSSVTVVEDRPLKDPNTAIWLAYREGQARVYQLERDTAARQNFSDLAAWYASGERSTLIVPMVAGGQTVGALRLGSELSNAFGFQENLDLIQRLANLMAVALENARLFQQATEREQFSAAMRRVSQSLNQIFDLSNVLRTICDESLPILGVEGAYVWLVVGKELIGIAASGPAQEAFSGMVVALNDPASLPSRVAAERRPIYLNDLQERDDRLQIVPLAALQTVNAVMGVPLLREDRVLGTLMLVEEHEGKWFDDLDVEQASAFAIQAAIAIENARLFEEAEQRASELDAQARRLALINVIATRLAQALTPEDIYQIALTEVQEALGAPFGGLAIFEDEKTARVVLSTHPADKGQSNAIVFSLEGNASVEYVRKTRQPLVSEDVLSDIRFQQTWEILEQRGTRSIMIVPLIVSDRVIGTLGLDFTQRRTFTEVEIELAETIASQISVALDKAQLLKEAEERARVLDEQARRLAFLNRLSQRLAATLDAEEIYRTLITALQQELGLQYGGLMLIQNDQISRLVLSTHPMDPPVPNFTISLQDNPIAQYILKTQQPFISENISEDPRFEGLWEFEEARDTRAMMIVPVIMGGRVIGTIGLDSSTPRHFTPAEIELAMATANQAAVAIEKGRLFAEAQQRARELDEQAQRLALINRVSTRLAATLDPQEIYAIVLSELAETLQVTTAGLVLFEDENTGRLVLNYPLHQPTPDLTLDLRGNRSIEFVRQTHKPLVSEDVLNDPAFEPAWEVLRMRGTKSLMIVPLLAGDQVIGTIGLDSATPRTFTDAERELAETIASQASLAIEKARLYSETLGLTIFNQAVVESIQQGIVVLDRSLNVRRVNRYMLERYGWDTSAVGQPLFEYRPDYESFLRKSVIVALGTGEPQVNYEIEHLDATGQRSIRNYYIYPMLEGRTVTGIVLLLEDVTERALLEADLNARAIQMAALSEVSSQITSTLDPDQVINLILDALDRVVPYDGVSLWLRSEEREELYIAAARGYKDPDSPNPDDLLGLTVEIPFSPLFREMASNAQVINVGDVSGGDPRFPYGSAAIYKNWLGAPLISKGKVVGVLTLEKREPHFYNTLHEQLALTFANQAAVALDNAQLFQETRARAIALDEQAQRLALLNRVSLALAQSLDLENIFEITLRETAIALDIPEGSAVQLDFENMLGRVIVEYPRGDAPPDRVFSLDDNEAIARVRHGLLPVVIEHLDTDPMADHLRPLMRRTDIASTLLVPLVVGGEVIGVLRLDAPGKPRQFTTGQIELAQTIASQAAIAVQNASLFEQASVRTSELETLFESAQATAVTLDLDEVVRRVTIQLLSALRTDACTVYLWNEVQNALEVRGDISARPGDAPQTLIGDKFDLKDYPLRARAVHTRELIIIRADDSDLPPGEADLMRRHHAASRMLIPLVVNEVSIGLAEVETLDPNRYFKAEDVRLARTLASQAAISIENARLQTETRRTVEELYIINDMSSALSSAVNLEQLLAVVDDQLPNLTDAPVIYVALYDAGTQTVSFPLAVYEGTPLNMADRPFGKDEFSHIIRQQSPLLLAGEFLDQVRRNLGIETIIPEARCFLGVPLFAGDDIVGVLAVRDDSDPLAFTHNDQRILTTVGAQLGVAIQSTRLFQQMLELAEELERRVRERTAELEQERQHISTLYQITTELATSLDVDRLLTRALEMVAHAVGATQAAILAVDPDTDQLRFRARYGWPVGTRPLRGDAEPPVLDQNQGLVGWVMQTGRSLIVDDVQKDPRWLRLDESDDLPRAALLAVLETNEGILGVMVLYSDREAAFTEDHLKLVTAAAHQVANAMNNAELYKIVADQADNLGRMLHHEQVEATKTAAVLDSVADGVMVADAEGRIIVFNTTAERILGVPAEHVLNRSTKEMVGLYGADSMRWMNTVAEWMRDPTQYEPGDFLEDRVVLEDNRVISVRLSPVHMGDQFLGTVSVFRDITREVEVDRLKSEFVATVSHELRTPMTSIKGYADLLLLGAAGEITDQQQRFLETIKQNADRLSILVNDLLDISRIDQGRIEMKFGAIEVEELLNTIADQIRGKSEDQKRPMNVVVTLPDDQHLMIWGDYDKIMRIFSNLADNAFNYTQPHGQITLSAAYDGTGDNVIVAVADTGVGIPPDVGDRVFERFYRGDESVELVMDTPGTGLGLAIVREMVQMHHGHIWYESEVGKGTTFYVELPAKAPVADPSSAS